MATKYYDLDELVFAEKPKGTRLRDLSDLVFGRLQVLGYAGKNSKGKLLWFCQCECGKIIENLRETPSLQRGEE